MKGKLALLLALTVLILSGCNTPEAPYVPTGDGLFDPSATTPSTAPQGPEQQLSLVYNPDVGLNPYTVSDLNNRTLFPLIYQGLFTVDREYEVSPVLCQSYTVSKDMKTYTFYLEEATFSDGSPLTPEDAAASLRQAKQEKIYQGRFRNVTGISVTEDGALQLTLSTPYENLPILLDVPIVKASDVALDTPMGTGAYSLAFGLESAGLLRQEDWWCQSDLLVTASYIPLTEASSPKEVRDAFEYGSAGLVCADPGSDTYVDYRGDHEVWECENGIFLYLACNESSPVFSNLQVRQALTHAIDRDTLVEDYYRGFAASAALPASPDWPHYSSSLAAKYDYDALAFLQALEDNRLQDSTVTLLVNKGDSRRVRAARAIAQMLKECGLKVITSELAGTAYKNALKQGKYDLHLGQTILSPNMDLSAFYDPKGALSYGGLSDAAILALCREALANAGNYYGLHQAVMEDAMLCPILFRSYAVYATRGLLSDIQPARDQVFYYQILKQET